jgi:hypothetical protein
VPTDVLNSKSSYCGGGLTWLFSWRNPDELADEGCARIAHIGLAMTRAGMDPE